MNWQGYRDAEIEKHDALIRHWLGEDLRHHGENRLGIEFKHDQRFRETGNFYIETAEKARPRDGDYAPSGIFRNDNTWLWVQGDVDEVWVFFKHTLLALNAEDSLRHVQKPTSLGYLLPLAQAREYVLRVLPHARAPRATLDEALRNPATAEAIRQSVDGTWVP